MRTQLSVLLAAVALAACGDPSGSSDDQHGLLRLDYTGAATGRYRAEAAAPDTTSGAAFAVARSVPFGFEIASRAETGVRVRLVTNQTRPGRYPFASVCDMLAASRCAAGRVQFPPDQATGVGATYVLIAGELNITSSSGGRVRGTFSGTAQRNVASEIQVRNGEFDVPVLSP